MSLVRVWPGLASDPETGGWFLDISSGSGFWSVFSAVSSVVSELRRPNEFRILLAILISEDRLNVSEVLREGSSKGIVS